MASKTIPCDVFMFKIQPSIQSYIDINILINIFISDSLFVSLHSKIIVKTKKRKKSVTGK